MHVCAWMHMHRLRQISGFLLPYNICLRWSIFCDCIWPTWLAEAAGQSEVEVWGECGGRSEMFMVHRLPHPSTSPRDSRQRKRKTQQPLNDCLQHYKRCFMCVIPNLQGRHSSLHFTNKLKFIRGSEWPKAKAGVCLSRVCGDGACLPSEGALSASPPQNPDNQGQLGRVWAPESGFCLPRPFPSRPSLRLMHGPGNALTLALCLPSTCEMPAPLLYLQDSLGHTALTHKPQISWSAWECGQDLLIVLTQESRLNETLFSWGTGDWQLKPWLLMFPPGRDICQFHSHFISHSKSHGPPTSEIPGD